MTFTDQSPYDIRCEWGPAAPSALTGCAVYIVVDILSFSTCHAVASERGAVVIPCPAEVDDLEEYARAEGAILAGKRGEGLSLSPTSLMAIEPGTRLLLPSPNGSRIAAAAIEAGGEVLIGALRNRSAVARRAMEIGRPIGVIPAGERWPDGSLRPALEDQIGAGGIIAALAGTKSPETIAAEWVFRASESDIPATLRICSSGRELIERGFGGDVGVAAEVDVIDPLGRPTGPSA